LESSRRSQDIGENLRVIEIDETKELVENADDPECELIGHLAGFVSQSLLSEVGGWPPANQLKEMKCVFGYSPTVGLGALFVGGVKMPCGYADQAKAA
jgi:hypothetical protein